jgi:hypothetical protein
MSLRSEYHQTVRHSIPLPLVLFSLLALSVTLVSTASAQINGAPASVTSPGFGGRAINGTPPSTTSLGPRAYVPGSGAPFFAPNAPRTGDSQHHHGHADGDHSHARLRAPWLYSVPYAVDLGPNDQADSDDPGADDSDANYQGGPTIFDRRGHGASSYVPPVADVPKPHSAQNSDQNSDASRDVDPEPPQAPTLLVFKDGHKLEIENYAIIGATLFDLTPGHSRKVPLADLDLEGTRQQNDDRGITFQLPSLQQAN